MRVRVHATVRACVSENPCMRAFRYMHIFMAERCHPQSAEYAILERVLLMKPIINESQRHAEYCQIAGVKLMLWKLKEEFSHFSFDHNSGHGKQSRTTGSSNFITPPRYEIWTEPSTRRSFLPS